MSSVDKLRAVVARGVELQVLATHLAVSGIGDAVLTHGDLRSLLARIDDLEDPDKNPLREEIRDLQACVRELAESRAELLAQKNELYETLTKAGARIAELERWGGDIHAQWVQAEARIDELEREVAEANQHMVDYSESLAVVRTERDTAESALARVADLVRAAEAYRDSEPRPATEGTGG